MADVKKIILLVEDDPITAVSEKLMLEANGYSVLTASSGRKAVEIASMSQVDLVLMDIELGGDMGGHGAAQQILEKKNIPIVFLTAHVGREMVEKVRSITRYGYSLKNSGDYVLLSSIEMAFELFEAHERTRISEENYRKLVEDISDMIFSIDYGGFFTYISPRVEHLGGYKADEISGRHFSNFIYGGDVERANRLMLSLREEREYKAVLRGIKKNGELAWFSMSLRPVFKNGIFTGANGIMADITERKRDREKVEALLAEKEGLLKEINCLYNVSRIAENHPTSVESMLSESISKIPDGFIFPENISVRINCGGNSFTSGTAEPVLKPIKKDIIVNKTAYGTIEAFYGGGHFFVERESEFLGSVADRLGRIIELIAAKNELRKLEKEIISISEGERQKIGREIHDSLGQMLTGISFMLKTVKNSIIESKSVSPDKINEISDLVYEATMICRKIAKGLPMQSIGRDNLVIAIDQLAINMRNLYQLNCEFAFGEEITVEDDFTSSQLYYIVQEAVNNAAKHSGAGNIKISLGKKDGSISLTVHDDGNGRSESESDGLGLSIMKYRSDLIGGVFRAENHYEQGFLVSVDVQL